MTKRLVWGFFLACVCGLVQAAPQDRITRTVNTRDTAAVETRVPRLAQPQYDQGAVEPEFRMDYMILLVKPSAAQRSELNTLLAEQQNPSSKQFHKWLTPEAFGDRFGLNTSDHSKLVAWLQAEGFTVHESARARNWIAFGGTAGQVQHALHTAIHRYRVDGEMHYGNSSEPAAPVALAEVIGGFSGLDDFRPRPSIKASIKTAKPDLNTPDFNVSTTHFIVPEDFATIYDVAPLYAAGIDGTGVNIGIIGGTTLQLADIRMFRSKYNLPANDPKSVLVGGNPGLDLNALLEANLDIEWSGAVAPNATIYFYYSTSLYGAIASAVNANVVQIISMSFGFSELDNTTLAFQPVLQQANAQGITMLAASGDSGAATAPDSSSNATRGPVVSTPASFPEVTAVGGTQFNEGTGTYWATTNSPNSGSALSYIPEIAWSGGGGGASAVFGKPAWQMGSGVPPDGMRDLPDVSLSATGSHDPYYIVFQGGFTGVGGTSASSPSMAGIVALLNHYLVANGNLAQPGLGNINPQLYRLAQSTPSAFHDITGGGNTVTCEQGSVDCGSGIFGYAAGPGYDLATGIGSIDANVFVTSWNNATNAVNVQLSATPAQGTFNDSIQLVATVTPASGAGTPTGIVEFSNGSIPLGSLPLDATSGVPTASLSVGGWQFGATGTFPVTAQYRGDAAFSGGGAIATVKVTAPTGVSSIVPSAPVSVSAEPDVSGVFWQFSLTLRERGGVAAVLTGFTIDGQSQAVAQYFPSASIPASGTISSQLIVFRNLAAPMVRTFGFSGFDAGGQTWTRQVSIAFLPPQDLRTVLLTAVPLTVQGNPSAADCKWPQQVIINENSGYAETIIGLAMGNISLSDQIVEIFGTSQLAPYRMLEGNICWSGATPGTSDTLRVSFASGLTEYLTVSFAGPAANPAAVSASPATVTLSTADATTQASLAVNAPDGQLWTASVFPQNRSTGWLTLSQVSGSGAAQIALQANGTGYENGVYLATVVIQGPNMSPAAISVPVMWVYGDSSKMTISGLVNAASGQSVAAPNMTATIRGTGLASTSLRSGSASFTYSTSAGPSGFGMTVNGVAAAFKSISPTQIDFQIPVETGVGPAVVGINNNGSIGGFLFEVSPAAPGIFADANGNVAPTATVQAGKALTLTMTGDGVLTPSLPDGFTAAANSSLFWKPALPFTVTIGGTPVFLTSYGLVAGAVAVTTVNVVVPASVPAGPQPVVVTVAGVASPPVNVNVTAGP